MTSRLFSIFRPVRGMALACTTFAIAEGSDLRGTVSAPNTPSDDAAVFLSTILASTEDFWGAAFKADGLTYEEPKLVLFSGMIGTGCGVVSGSSYCARDHKIYVDPTFADLQRIGINGELAQALIVAREVAHHVQNITEAPVQSAAAGEHAGALELQVDCFIGLWSRYAHDQGLLKDEDLTAARGLLPRLRDEQAAGPASDQRIQWFNRGLAGQGIADCDTLGDQP